MPEVPTPKHQLTQPADDDFINDWPLLMRQALAELDAIIAAASTELPRPAAGISGRFHHAPDGTVSFDTGDAWVEIARMPHADRHHELGSDPLYGQLPIGGMIPYAGIALPPGGRFAWADGSLIDRLDGGGNPTEFFARVGHAYNGGADPGASKVRLPDKRGRGSLGADSMGVGAAGRLTVAGGHSNARGQNGGAENHTLTTAQLAAHAHGYSDPGHYHSTHYNFGAGGGVAGLPFYEENGHQFDTNVNTNPPAGSNGYTNISIANAGGGGAHNNMHPYEVDNWIVRIA